MDELPPERDMVERFGITRSKLRGVLMELRKENAIAPAQIGRRNSRENGPSIEKLVQLANPADVVELRLMFEPQFARHAAIKASSLEVARIVRTADSARIQSYGEPDLAFHLEIAAASHNSLAREIYSIIRMVGADGRVRVVDNSKPCPNRRKQRDEEHMRIAHAIRARDPDAAEESMRAHLRKVRTLILDQMSPG